MSIVILQMLRKTRGELGEANRSATRPAGFEFIRLTNHCEVKMITMELPLQRLLIHNYSE